MQYHKLTELIKDSTSSYTHSLYDIDAVVVKFLSEAAKELKGQLLPPWVEEKVDSILGLQPSSEKRNPYEYDGDGLRQIAQGVHFDGGYLKKDEAPQPKEVVWCDHLEAGDQGYRYHGTSEGNKRIGYFLNTDPWKTCPECQKPRPTPRSLKESLAEELRKKSPNFNDGSLQDYAAVYWNALAEIAIEFLQKEEK